MITHSEIQGNVGDVVGSLEGGCRHRRLEEGNTFRHVLGRAALWEAGGKGGSPKGSVATQLGGWKNRRHKGDGEERGRGC